jgi:transposase
LRISVHHAGCYPFRRQQLGSNAPLHILSIESLLARQLNLRLNAEQVKRLDDADVSALSLPPHVERALMASLAVLHTLHVDITALAAILHQEAQLPPQLRS